MKKLLWIANSSLFCVILIIGGVAFWTLPKQTISSDENRKLMDFPLANQETIFSGKFEKAFEEYYNDHFPLRENWLTLANHLNTFKGSQEQEIRVITLNNQHNDEIYLDQEMITEETSSASNIDVSDSALERNVDTEKSEEAHEPLTTDTTSNTETVEVESAKNTEKHLPSDINEEFNRIKGVIVVNGRVLQIFAGSKQTITPYVNMLTTYRKKLANDIKMYTMMIPSGSDFYLPYQVNKGVLKEKENIELFNSLLPKNIVSVPVYKEMEPHKNEYIQFRTDHHWTGLGAYYAYVAFAKKAGFQPLALSDMQYEAKKASFLGSLYNYTKDNELKKNPDLLEYYKVPTQSVVKIYGDAPTPIAGQVYAEKNNNYVLFIGGDNPLVHFHTETSERKSLLVVKDSFGNALIPYLTAHYKDIYVVDYRYFKGNILRLMKRHDIKELLYAHNTFAANTKTTTKLGLQMLK